MRQWNEKEGEGERESVVLSCLISEGEGEEGKKTELHFSLICGGAVDVHDHQCRRGDGRAISRKTDELRLSHFSNFSASEKAKQCF